jgi:hypothetical protein
MHLNIKEGNQLQQE